MNRYTPTFVFLLVCLIFVLGNMGCANTSSKIVTKPKVIIRVPTKITNYPLRDSKGIIHKYTDNVESFIFPQDNKKLTQYCAFHFDWEDIKAIWSKDRNGEYRWKYVVSKNKMSHKMRRR